MYKRQIWHGAGWNFVLWGAIHGGALIVNRLLGAKLNLPAFFSWLLTMLTSFCAWLGFYETRTGVLALKMKSLFTPEAYGRLAWHEAAALYLTPDGLVLCCFLALTGAILLLEWLSIARHDAPYCLLQRPWMAVILILLTVILAPEKNNGFIYFAF